MSVDCTAKVKYVTATGHSIREMPCVFPAMDLDGNVFNECGNIDGTDHSCAVIVDEQGFVLLDGDCTHKCYDEEEQNAIFPRFSRIVNNRSPVLSRYSRRMNDQKRSKVSSRSRKRGVNRTELARTGAKRFQRSNSISRLHQRNRTKLKKMPSIAW